MVIAWFSALGFAASLAGLYLAADALVRGSLILARSLGATPMVAGLTIVAFGGSAPELAIGVLAAAEDHGSLALGNVVGSNIANIALILGLCAVIHPIRVRPRLLTHEMFFMVGSAGLLLLLGLDGRLGRVDAGIFGLAFLAFLLLVRAGARGEPARLEAQFEREVAELQGEPGQPPGRGRGALLAAVGLLGLALSAHVMVLSVEFFARRLGVGEALVGLTVVALGTSLPELATSIVAIVRRETDIAVGNLVGSNVFNALAILAVAALVRPLPVARSLYGLELPVLLVVSAALLPLARTRARLDRWEGGGLVLAYAAFLWLVVIRGLGGSVAG